MLQKVTAIICSDYLKSEKSAIFSMYANFKGPISYIFLVLFSFSLCGPFIMMICTMIRFSLAILKPLFVPLWIKRILYCAFQTDICKNQFTPGHVKLLEVQPHGNTCVNAPKTHLLCLCFAWYPCDFCFDILSRPYPDFPRSESPVWFFPWLQWDTLVLYLSLLIYATYTMRLVHASVFTS